VYVRQRAVTKQVVGRSQRYKRLVSGLQSLNRPVEVDSRDAVAAGAVTVSTADVAHCGFGIFLSHPLLLCTRSSSWG